MTDPQNPQYPQNPPSPPYSEQTPGAPGAAPGYGGPPAYPAPPGYDPAASGQADGYRPPGAPSPPPQPAPPGQTLGIVAFVLSFFVQLVALVLGIVALVQSRRAGAKNGWAVAAIIISSVLLVLGIIAIIVFFAALGPVLFEYARLCSEYGPGRHVVDGWTIVCPTR